MKKIFDIVIIGAGPAGMYTAFLGSEKGLHAALVDALPESGGQLTALYPQKYIYDVAAYPRVTAQKLADELKKQVAQHDIPIMHEFKVTHLNREIGGEYKLTAEDGRYLFGRYVIIAAGAGMITPRKLELAEAEQYLGKGFEYVVANAEVYRDQRVLVIGGGDTALDWAFFFTATAKSVTLIHRTGRFVGFESSLTRLRNSSCQIYTDTTLATISGTGRVEKIQISNIKENWTKELEVDRLLGCIGFTPKMGFLKESGFEIAEASLRTDGNMQTNLENVYAVGDISNHTGRIKLISTGFGNVQVAVNHILRQINERREDVKNLELEKL